MIARPDPILRTNIEPIKLGLRPTRSDQLPATHDVMPRAIAAKEIRWAMAARARPTSLAMTGKNGASELPDVVTMNVPAQQTTSMATRRNVVSVGAAG